MIGQIAFLGGWSNTALSPCFAMPLNARGEEFSSKMQKGWSPGIIGWILRTIFLHINNLEARAFLNSLLTFRDHIRNSRVDVHTDS